MENDDRSSTASTVSGIYRNILQSPAPICMFYFAHPFGILESTPPRSKRQNQFTNHRRQQTTRNESHIRRIQPAKTCDKHYHPNYDENRMATYTPWPRVTWRRDYVLPPLVQLLAVQKANQNVPDLETILKTIRSAWNTPKSRSVINSRACDFSDSSSNSATSFHNSSKMGSGTNSTMVGPGLLRRRYSVPEIIMRKHSLAQQKSIDESIAAPASSAPTPHHSPTPHKRNSSNSSTHSSGSDTNVSRNGDRDTSMRRQLLRRIWSKEFREYTESRSGSWSPPMRRSQRRLHVEVAERCKECSKIEQTCQLASPKRVRLNSSPTASTACLQSTINSANSNRLTSSSELATHTSCSTGTTETSSSSGCDTQQEPEQNIFAYMTPRETSSADDNVDDDETPELLQVEIADQIQPIPSTTTTNTDDTDDIVDSGHHEHDNASTNDESINNSRTEGEDNENRNDLSRNTNGHTTAETFEENGNDVDGVDQYVSTLLVNSLNNLMDTVNEPMYITRNNVTNNRRDCVENVTDTLKVDENENENHSIVSIDACNAYEPIETKSNNIIPFDSVEHAVVSYELDLQNANTINVVDQERLIYFPQYTAESKDDESIYSTQLSEEDFLDSHPSSVIPVQAGSSYPNYDRTHETIVSRIVRRTESMEAEPSSASPREDHGGNDSDASLVDSLDEPISLKSECVVSSDTQPVCPGIEKSQTFFVPIVDDNQPIDEHIDVASAMPDKLRDKLVKRQQDLDAKKKQEINKKQKKIQKIINRNQVKEVDDSDKSNKSKPATTSSSTTTKQDGKSGNVTASNTTKGNKNKFLRSEIGMLESYRIDGRGNMQFVAPQKCETASSSVKRNPQPVKNAQSRKGDIITIKRSQTKKSTIDTNQRRKEVIKDVQHMTLYQAQPDLITPDIECGPRRMYQKTEIRDGEKRIEILEIVECVDSCSSADGSGSPNEHTYRTRSATLMRKSKIPIPIYKVGQAIGFQKSMECASRDGGSPGKIFIKNIKQLGNNTKVDQMIADLLIEALNHPKEMGIEFVKSPKEFSRGGSGNSKRPLISRRNITGSRRSAGGTKYQQVFEVIPEEKSSFSVDSSTEESNFSLNTQANNLMNESRDASVRNISSSSAKASSTESKLSHSRIPRGKEAIESDTLSETEAWVGFFKQHDDSLVDSGNEDDQKRNLSAADFTNDSFQQKTVKVIEKPSKTIKQLNSPYSSSVFTPISSSDIFVSSSGSENIFTIIDKTFIDTPDDHQIRSVHFDTPISVSANSYNKSVCTECDSIEKELRDKVEENVTEMKADTSKPNESDVIVTEMDSSLNSEAIQPHDEKVQRSPLQVEDIKDFSHSQKDSQKDSQEPSQDLIPNAEIDTTSFIVLRDDEHSLLKAEKTEAKIMDDLPNSRERCIDCCFCNPDLHRRDGASSVTSCNFCNKQKPSSKTRDTESRSTNTARVYESLSKSDHTHIRTRSKESDTVSLKCTRTNSRIRRFVPEDALNGNVCDDGGEKINKNRSTKIDLSKKPPKPPTISPARKVNTEKTSPLHRINNKTTSGIRLPSPFVTGMSSQSFDSTSSPCSSSSSCSPCSPKKCPPLPTGRWQNSGVQKQLNKTRASRYKDFYGEHEKNQMVNKNDMVNVSSPGQNTGWSLTLAGTYNDEMAPDVEMRLSFPKKNGKVDSESSSLNRTIQNTHKQENGNYHQYQREQSDVSNENYNLNNRAALPATGTGNVNPKRTLSKTVIDKNRNIRNYNLPDLNSFNGTVAQQTARKTIKRSEYSVAVQSATRTISNFSHGKQRAMSFQALNANAYRFDNRDQRRDHSVDLGHLSSRRMSIDSHTPSETMALSVLGNHIAPEQKPRVPTMSERDLTRKHSSCFTRNRSFFS